MYKGKKTILKELIYLGAAVFQGQRIPGVQKTPDILRKAKLLQALTQKYEINIKDIGNISAQNIPSLNVNLQQSKHHVKNLALLDALLGKIHASIITALVQSPQSLMLTIGGDHSVGTATLHALHKVHQDLKVIWVDAHPDFLDPLLTTYYGYHGYPLSHATGLAKFPGFEWIDNPLPFKNIVHVAIRDIDPDEWINLKKYGIKCFTMDHVDSLGIGEVMRQAIEYLDPVGDKPFHISFDIDAIDPELARGTGTKFRGGLNQRQACHIIKRVAHERKLVGLDVVQINESLEVEQLRTAYRGEQFYGPVSPTVGLGIDLIESLFQQYLTL